MSHTIMMLLVIALLATGAPVDACEPHNKNRPLSVQRQMESRSWRVGGYTKRQFTGRDSLGNRFGRTVEELPSGSFKFKTWERRDPTAGRIQRFLESRK